MAEVPTMVVKVGGSLYNLPDLAVRLATWLRSLPPARLLLVPGGGASADALRDLDRLHQLGEEQAHWLALRALTFNAHWLQAVLSRAWGGAIPIAAPPWDDDRVCASLMLVDAHAFATADEGCAGCLPHSWQATSDSVAARVAMVTAATELILLKSAEPPPCDWSAAGYVDPVFADIVAQVQQPFAVRAVNLRQFRVSLFARPSEGR